MDIEQKNGTILRWVKRLLLLVAGLLLGVAMLVGGTVFYLDDEDYRRLLIRGVDRFLAARLEINGPFSLTPGRDLRLVAEDVRLTANDGSYTFEAGEVDLSQRFGSWLMTGTFWTNHLFLADAQLSLKAGEERRLHPEDWHLPPVVVQEARVGNLHIVYEPREGDRHEISVLDLEVDDINDNGPVGIRGEGVVNGRQVAIDGSLDSVAGLTDTSQPYSIELKLVAGNLVLRLSGSIRDPVRGRGMALQAVLEDESISDTLKLFDRTAPEIGSLTAGLHVSGDYDSPSLHDIDIRLQRESEVDIRVTGRVSDVMTGRGVDLVIDGQSSDPQVLSWLLFEREDQIDSFSLSGRIAEDNGHFLMRDVDARARSRLGLEAYLTGNTRIPTPKDPRPAGAEALSIKLKAPDIAALNLPEFGKLPEFGQVNGSASYRPYWDGTGLSDLRLEAGTKDQSNATVTGSIGFIPYTYNTGLSGIDLGVNLTAVDSTVLGPAIGVELPKLGAVRLDMQVRGDTDNLQVDGISLETGPADQPVIRASGNLRTQLRKHTSTITATFDVAVADIVAALRDVPTGYLGRIEGSFEMSDVDGSWGLDRFDVKSTQTDLYDLNLTGALDDVVKRDHAEIVVKARISDPVAFGRAADINLRGNSPYRVDGRISFEKEQVHYLGSASVGRTQSETRLRGTMTDGKAGLKGEFVIPVLYLDDFGIPPEPADPSQAAERIRLASDRKRKKAPAFSRQPVNLEVLGLADLDIEIDVGSIDSGGRSAAQKLEGRLVLKDRVLHIAPFRLVAKGGPTDLELKIDARDVPAVELKMSADDQTLGPWLAQVQGKVPVEGYANYHIDLTARGASPHELASSLNGHVSLAFENAKIPIRYIEYLSVDVFGWAVGKLHTEERYARLDCVLADFDIRDGVMNSTLLAADGPRLAMEGDLTLDLGNETIDAVFLPKQKRKLFASVSPVRLSGDMRDPDVTAIPAKEAAKNIGALVLVPYVAIPVSIFGKLWGSVDDKDTQGGGCANLQREKAEEAAKAAKEGKARPQDSSWDE